MEIQKIAGGCVTTFEEMFQVGLTGPNGEFCETPTVRDLVNADLGDCGKLRLSDGMTRMLFKGTAAGNDFCFSGSIVTLSNGDQYGCPADKTAKLSNGQFSCKAYKLNAGNIYSNRLFYI